jgi:hypothetical protein
MVFFDTTSIYFEGEGGETLAFLLQSFGKMGLLWSVNPRGIRGVFFEHQKCSARK